MSTIQVDTIQKRDGSTFPIGKLGQIVTVRKTNTFSTSSTGSFVDLTDVTLNITPTATSSKILVDFRAFGSNSGGTDIIITRLLRDSTEVGSGSGGGTYDGFGIASVSGSYELVNLSMNLMDEPSTTSQITYKIQCRVNASTGYIGRKGNADHYRFPTSLMAMEILA
tara:strand:- start:967 stop:1467 length:501 start_codon:yes stop_codon:yes gene_type:complete